MAERLNLRHPNVSAGLKAATYGIALSTMTILAGGIVIAAGIAAGFGAAIGLGSTAAAATGMIGLGLGAGFVGMFGVNLLVPTSIG